MRHYSPVGDQRNSNIRFKPNILLLAIFLMINGLVIGIVSADQVLIKDKTVHFTDEALRVWKDGEWIYTEQNHLRFTLTEQQYAEFGSLEIEYRISNPQASITLYQTTDEYYELSKQGHGIKYSGIGSQLFGDGVLKRDLKFSRFHTGNNNIRIYGMVRPFNIESDVTFTITLKNKKEDPEHQVVDEYRLHGENIIAHTKTMNTVDVTQNPANPGHVTSVPITTPSSPINWVIPIASLIIFGLFVIYKRH